MGHQSGIDLGYFPGLKIETGAPRLLRWRSAVGALGCGTHDGDGGGEEGAVLDGAFGADRVADLDVRQGDGIAAFAEGGVFIGDEGMGGVIRTSLQGDLDVVDGGYAAH